MSKNNHKNKRMIILLIFTLSLLSGSALIFSSLAIYHLSPTDSLVMLLLGFLLMPFIRTLLINTMIFKKWFIYLVMFGCTGILVYDAQDEALRDDAAKAITQTIEDIKNSNFNFEYREKRTVIFGGEEITYN